MLRALVFFLLAMTLNGCLKPIVPLDRGESIPELEYAVISYTTDLEKSEAVFLLDSRAYLDEENIELVMMKFRTQRIMEVLEARDLIVNIVEGFLERVNNDELLPAFLTHFPLTADNLCVDIAFESFYGRYIDPLSMAHVILEDGLVYYYANNACDPDSWVYDQRVETYEKAYRFSVFRQAAEAIAKERAKEQEAAALAHSDTNAPEDRLNAVLSREFNQTDSNNQVVQPSNPQGGQPPHNP